MKLFKRKKKDKKTPGAFKLAWLKCEKMFKILGLFICLAISITLPQSFATAYEYTCYARSADASKAIIAHYANMITYGYNVAALATVVLVSGCVIGIYKEFKKPNYYKAFLTKVGEANGK